MGGMRLRKQDYMIKTITGAFERAFIKNNTPQTRYSTGQALSAASGSLSVRELRLLVAGMVD